MSARVERTPLWLRVAARLVPREERKRLEEWRSELSSAEARGASGLRRVQWAAGVFAAAVQFRGEELSMEGWGREVRHAVRGLLRRPGFAPVTVLTLSLGIGANTAMFSVVNGVLLRSLPYPEPERLVRVHTAFPTLDFQKFRVSPPEYLEIQERSSSFEVLGAYRDGQVSICGGEQPERVTGACDRDALRGRRGRADPRADVPPRGGPARPRGRGAPLARAVDATVRRRPHDRGARHRHQRDPAHGRRRDASGLRHRGARHRSIFRSPSTPRSGTPSGDRTSST